MNSCTSTLVTSPVTVNQKKLVVSPAVNQGLHSLSVRLLRVDCLSIATYLCVVATLYDRGPSAAVAIVFVGAAAACAATRPTARRSLFYASSYAPRDLHSDRCRQCPPQVIADQW